MYFMCLILGHTLDNNLINMRGTINIVDCINSDSSITPSMLVHRDEQHTAQTGCSYQAAQVISWKGASGLRITPESSPANFISSVARIYDI